MDEIMEIYTRIANLHRELAEAYDELALSFCTEDEDEDEDLEISYKFIENEEEE